MFSIKRAIIFTFSLEYHENDNFLKHNIGRKKNH